MPGSLDDLTVDRLQLGLIVCAAIWRLLLFRSHLQVTFSTLDYSYKIQVSGLHCRCQGSRREDEKT